MIQEEKKKISLVLHFYQSSLNKIHLLTEASHGLTAKFTNGSVFLSFFSPKIDMFQHVANEKLTTQLMNILSSCKYFKALHLFRDSYIKAMVSFIQNNLDFV